MAFEETRRIIGALLQVSLRKHESGVSDVQSKVKRKL